MRFFDYSTVELEEDTGELFSGISYFPTPTEIFGDEIVRTTELRADEIYRPDKLAKRLWGVPNANWILDILNDFETGIKEYTKNVEIKYVTAERLRSLGLI